MVWCETIDAQAGYVIKSARVCFVSGGPWLSRRFVLKGQDFS
jgi:hypothetical protein